MLSVAFWNTKRGRTGYGPLVALARDVAGEPGLSGPQAETLLCFAEPGALHAAGLQAALLAADPGRAWWSTMSISGRFLLAGTIPAASVLPYPEAGGGYPCSVTRTNGGQVQSYQVCFVHLASSLGVGDRTIHSMRTASDLRVALEAHENTVANGQTIVIGDFNMRPYDAGMVAPSALHAASCLHAASRPRTIAGAQRPYFYNACWELLGNWSPQRQPGTFYMLDPTDSVRWHLIDQVLIRPGFAAKLHTLGPRIVTQVGTTMLTTARGNINGSISDHLPIVISLSI